MQTILLQMRVFMLRDMNRDQFTTPITTVTHQIIHISKPVMLNKIALSSKLAEA